VGATAAQIAKTEAVREKMVGILADKFRIRVQDCRVPVALLVEDDHLVGLKMRTTEVRDGRAMQIDGSDEDVRSKLIVSSIGSVPERVEGIPTRGELYDYASWDTGAVTGLPGVFGLGNVLTGKGNIRESRSNAQEISAQVIAEYLGLTDARDADPMAGGHSAARERGAAIAESAIRRAKVSPDKLKALAAIIEARWDATGYDGDYASWIAAHPPSG
jgi:hypothetical protein